MKSRKTWSSAEGSAAARACESMLPENKRLFYDPWAKHFLSYKYSGFILQELLSRLPLLKSFMRWYAEFARKCIIWYMNRLYPGGYGFIVVRTNP